MADIEKGDYRSIYSLIWDDPEFQSFPPITQLVFLHLRTCPECNWPAIFNFYPSLLKERIAAPAREIDRAWETLLERGWIRYERPILWIVKGLRNEPSFSFSNSNHVASVIKVVKSLPKLNILNEFARYYGLSFSVECIRKPGRNPMGDGMPNGMGDGMGDGIPNAMGDHGNGNGNGNGNKSGSAPPPPETGDGPPPLRVGSPLASPEMLRDAWNLHCPSLPRCVMLSPSRRARCNARARERPIEEWVEIFKRIEASPFCRGQNDRGWKADFEWIVKSPDNAIKVLEGKYDAPAGNGGRDDSWIDELKREREAKKHVVAG